MVVTYIITILKWLFLMVSLDLLRHHHTNIERTKA